MPFQFEKAFMVGDRISIDLAPAKKLGMLTVYVSEVAVQSAFVDFIAIDAISACEIILTYIKRFTAI